jgi:hypothetical protein
LQKCERTHGNVCEHEERRSPPANSREPPDTAGRWRFTSAKELGMAVAVRCQHCGQRYSVREDLLGKQIKCKACSHVMSIVAEPAPAKTAAPKAAAQALPAAMQPAVKARTASAVGKAPGAAPRPKQIAPATAARGLNDSAAKPAATKAPKIDLLGAAAPANDPLFGPSNNLLDLLSDASLPAAGAAPLNSGVALKPAKAAPASKPTAKKKKKKKGSTGASIQTQTAMRMLGGVFVILLGLGAFGMAIAKLAGDDDSGFHVYRAIRWSMLGISLVGAGLKLIVG